MDEAKKAISVGKQTIWRMETGQPVRLRLIDVERLCQVYGADDTKTAVLLGLAEEAQSKGWWNAFDDAIPQDFNLFVGLEQSAQRLTSYQPLLVPGLLQTVEYRREVLWSEFPNMETSEVERRIELSQHRKVRLADTENPIQLAIIVDELALRRPIGGPEVMASQIRHLLEFGTLENISIRLVPKSVGMHIGMITNNFVLMEFPPHPRAHLTEPPIVFVQGYTGGLYLEKASEVAIYRDACARLQRIVLAENDSRTVMTHILKELTR